MITPEQRADIARDAQVVRDYIPRGYLVAHRTANAVDVLLDALDAIEEERDYHHARADVLLAKVSGSVALRGGKPGDYWRQWHIDHCAAAQAAERAEAKVARVEALADEWQRNRFPAADLQRLRAALADTPTIPDPTFDAREIAYKAAQDNAEPIGGE